jgi:type IV secretion system protein VirB3
MRQAHMNPLMNPLRDPVFKGCTRPAMLWGVPLVPFLMVGGSILIPAIWALLASPPVGVGIVLLLIPVFVTTSAWRSSHCAFVW